jgi:ATP-dependent protease Clp ATPase subunit
LYKIRDARLNQFGFVTKPDGKQAAHFMKTDLQEFGMPDEMVRGVDTVVEMNKLTKGDLVSILKHSKLSVFRRYSAELHKLGVRLRYNESLFDCIAETSFSPETGARELSNTVNYMFEEIMYEVIANPKKYTSCTLSLDIVCDNTKYKLS